MRAAIVVVVVVNMLLTMAMFSLDSGARFRWLMAKVFDISGRGPSNRRLLIAGVLMIVASVVVATLLVFKSQGRLENYTRVTAAMKNVGDGLPSRPTSATTGCWSVRPPR